MKYLRQSTGATIAVGPFLSKTDAVTPVTNLTASSTLNGRAVSNGTGAAYAPASLAHDANGHYLAALAAADVPSPGRLRLEFSDPATYLPVWEDFTVLPPAVYDAVFAGTNYAAFFPVGTVVGSPTATAVTVDFGAGYAFTNFAAFAGSLLEITLSDRATVSATVLAAGPVLGQPSQVLFNFAPGAALAVAPVATNQAVVR